MQSKKIEKVGVYKMQQNLTEADIPERPADAEERHFEVSGDRLYIIEGPERVLIANFHLTIAARSMLIDEDRTNGQVIDLDVHFNGSIRRIRVTDREFQAGQVMVPVWEAVGPKAICYGSRKDLIIATQELSSGAIPVKRVLTGGGFTADGCYLYPGMRITPQGIVPLTDIEIDVAGGNFSRHLGLTFPELDRVRGVAEHIFSDFLNLKRHAVTYPLMAHVCLAPFSSQIAMLTGKRKPLVHLQGPSGGGKTMAASLAMSFFGDFQDHFIPWTSTANAIEKEGYYFRDALFLIDDLKQGMISQESVIRILQNYVDGQGRTRLGTNARLQSPTYIRGQILSTGEDFIDGIESISGRTIVLQVEPEKNIEAGRRCLENRHLYRMFMPGFIHSVISNPNWQTEFRDGVDALISDFNELTMALSNGLRVSSNWALNGMGFRMFINYLEQLGTIDGEIKARMMSEYLEIAKEHLRVQAENLIEADPVSILFDVLQQKLAAGQATISNLNGNSSGRGRAIGTAREDQGAVFIYPEILMEMLTGHFRSVGQKMPFSKGAIRDALARQGLISQFQNGRYTHQVRVEAGRRINAWEFPLEQFRGRCGMSSETNQL